MKTNISMKAWKTGIIMAVTGVWVLLPASGRAHCDTMDGPVVSAARTALAKKDITPVLKWVNQAAEPEIKSAFARALAVRLKGAEARELADQYFFETLVRVHRAGEGAPYTGLKPAGTDPGPAMIAADKALESGSVDAAVKLVTDAAAEGIRKRFARVREMKEHADHNVESGREFVAAYVDYMHYLEGLHETARRGGGHGEAQPAQPEHAEHNH